MQSNSAWKHVATFTSQTAARAWAEEQAAAGFTVRIEDGSPKPNTEKQWIGCMRRRNGKVKRFFQGFGVGARVMFPKPAGPGQVPGTIKDHTSAQSGT